MASIFEVARYILEKSGEMTAMKLQKLMYYAQAWYMVWDEETLFEDDFQAWANGPVLPDLYHRHRGRFKVDLNLFEDSSSERLLPNQRDTIDRVLIFYGSKSAQWLSNLTHQEDPWVNARHGLAPGDPSNEVISKAGIHEYYSSL